MLPVPRQPDKKNRPASLMTPDGFEFCSDLAAGFAAAQTTE